MSRKAPWVCAGIFAAIHVVLVAIPVISSGGVGEGQGLAVALFDAPLVFLMLRTHAGTCILYGCLEPSPIPYVIFFPVVGTLMYAVFGYLVCVLFRPLFRRFVSFLKRSVHEA